MRALLGSPAGRLSVALVALLAAGTAAGLILLWPGTVDAQLNQGLVAATESGSIERVETFRCPAPAAAPGDCREVTVRVLSGPDDGETTAIALAPGGLDPELAVGDEVRLSPGASGPADATPNTYVINDFERGPPMLYLALGFAALVILFGGLRGALSLVGLALSLALVIVFVVPAILTGEPPLAVAIVGSLAVMLVTIPLAHGFGAKSVAALLGTAVSLVLTVALAVLFTDLTHLTGLSSETATLLQTGDAGLSVQGLLLAGMVIAALGVLDDMTISQASAVLALRRASPGLGFAELYRRAIEIGRDHVSALVNTLVLAYVGASLPVLLLFASGELGLVEAANVELIAKEIVATLVGSIGLIAAAPITTALAAVMALRVPVVALGEDAHPHAH